LLLILDDILDFSKIEAGKLALEAIRFNLRDALNEMLKLLELPAQNKGLTLACHIRPDVPEWISGDPGRLRQIIVNLVSNAIKFTERGGVEVVVDIERHGASTIDQTRESIGQQPAPRDQPTTVVLSFAVTDTGCGVAPEMQEKIFDAFIQVENSPTRSHSGTGLGLAICRKLIEMMDGRIRVESRIGHGSMFRFTARFGAASPPEMAPNAITTRRLPQRGRRSLHILVAEDNGVNQKLMIGLLTQWGHRVTVADNGRRALAALHEQTVDLLLLDMQMPEMNGFEVAAVIRNQETATGKHIPIIGLTAYAMKGDRERCLQGGMNGYMSKPINTRVLFEMIENLSAGSDHRPSGAGESDPAGNGDILNKDEALARVDGNKTLLAEEENRSCEF
jgi:CheY-like chemotaxis protein